MNVRLIIFFVAIAQQLNSHTGHLFYIQNQGQWESAVLYKAPIKQGAIFLERERLTVHLRESKHFHFDKKADSNQWRGHVYQIQFLGANLEAKVSGKEKVDEYFNYYLGNDPKKWKTGVGAFEEVVYENIYPNIDLHISSRDLQPKYTFYCRQGANPSQIQLRFSGLDSLTLDAKGNLISHTSMGRIVDEAPITYIHAEGQRRMIRSGFRLEQQTISFDLEQREIKAGETLEIDPQIIFSTYSGSTSDNFGASATFDFQGNAYGTGLVFGAQYITTPGAYQTTFNGTQSQVSDIGITKFNPTGSARIYSTYLGGNSYDVPHSLVVDNNDRLIILATTSSTNYPTTAGAFQTSHGGGPALNTTSPIGSLNGLGIRYPNGADIAITKFNANGTALLGSTYYGGSGSDGVGISTGLVINYGDGIRGEVMSDTFGNIYVASMSNSTNLQMANSPAIGSNAGGYDGIVLKFNTGLTGLLGSSYFGGSSDDAIYDMSFDQSGNIVAGGGTTSSNLPITTGVVNTTYSGGTDGMVVSFNNNVSTRRFATYYGTSDYDQIYFAEVDQANNIYLYGQTTHQATNYYLLNQGFANAHKGQFISVLNPTLTAKIRSTTFGAGNQNPDISPTAFLVDYCDKIFIAGWGSNLGTFNTFALSTSGLPVTANAFQPTALGNGFYMMILEGNLSAQYYGSFFGGTTTQSEEHVDGGTSRFDKNGIVYHAVCAGCGGNQNFPIFPNATSVAGPTNNSSNCNLGVFKFDFGLPVNADFTSTSVCAPGQVTFTNLSHQVSATPQWRWSFSNGQTSTLKNPVITFTQPGVYTARLVIIDSTSCNITDTIVKSVLVLGTTPDTLSTKSMCIGSSVRIGFGNIVDPSLTFTWTPTSTLDDPTILSPFASPQVTTDYRIILSRAGCIDTFYQRVVVDTPKPLSIQGPSQFCINATGMYTATQYSQGVYDWNPKVQLVSSNRDTGRYSFTSLPRTISVSYTTTAGCVSTANLTVNQGTPTLNLQSDTLICAGDIMPIIRQVNISGGSYSYLPANIPIIRTSGDTVFVRVDSSLSLIVNYNISAGCSAADTIRYRTIADVIKWNIDSVICYNATTTATVNVVPNYNIQWLPAGLLTTPQGQGTASFNLGNKDTFVRLVVTHNQKSYCKFQDSIRVRFLENLIKLKADSLECQDSIITIRTGRNAQGTYTWSPSAQLLSTTDTSARFRLDRSRWFYLTIQDNKGCSAKDSVQVRTVNDLLEITGDTVICINKLAKLNATVIPQATYLWLPGPQIIAGAGTPSVEVSISSPRYFYLHLQDSRGCYIIDSVKVQFFDSANILRANFNATTNCLNQLVNFTNISTGIKPTTTYAWNFDGQGTSALASPSFNFSPGGLRNIRLIITDTLVCNRADTITRQILILNNGTQNLPSIKACRGDTIQIGLPGMVDPTATISWTPMTSMIGTGFSPKVFPSVTTNFRAIISKGGCNDTLFQLVEIDTPSFVKIAGDTITCLNGQLNFTATQSPIGIYTWFPTGNVVRQNRDSATMIITADKQWIKVQLTSTFGCKNLDSIQVSVITPSLTLQMDSVGCQNEQISLALSANPIGGSYVFSPSSIVLTSPNAAQFQIDTTRLISVTYRVNNTCVVSKNQKLQLLKDLINWQYDTVTCRNDVLQTASNGNARYSTVWGPTSLLQTTQGQPNATFGNFTQSASIWIQSVLLSRPSCQYRDTAKITLFDEYIKIIGDTVVCRDSFLRLQVNVTPGASYTWRPANLLRNQVGNQAIFSVDTTRYFYVEANYKNRCNAKDSILVRIADNFLNITGDTILCANDNTTLTATPMAGATYTWSNGSNANPINVTVGATTNYQLTVIDANRCVLKSNFVVNTLDSSSFKIITTDTKSCKFDSVYIEATRWSGVIYQWLPNSRIHRGQGTHRIAAWIDTTTTFYVLGGFSRPGGITCSVLDSITIQKDTQYLEIKGKNLVCKGDTVLVTANFNPSFTYNWSTGSLVNNAGRFANYRIVDSTYVICDARSSSFQLCEYKDTLRIDYSRDLDDLRVTADPPSIEYGQTSQLSATATNIVDYVWSPRATLNNYLIPRPTAKPPTTTTYYVTVQNPLGCRSGDSVVVDVFYEECREPEVYLPTGFTPNADGKNDILYLKGDNIEQMYLMIYDRWGQLMFETKTQKIGWDGTYKGAAMEPAVFAFHYWVQCIGGATYSKNGNVTLIK